MYVNVFRRSDWRMIAERKYFRDRASADRFVKYVAPKIFGNDTYFYELR